MKRLVKSADTQFAQQLVVAAKELDSALVSLTTAYRAYEQWRKTAEITDEQYSEFEEITEGIEHQFRQFTVKADEIELLTSAEQLVEFFNKNGK